MQKSKLSWPVLVALILLAGVITYCLTFGMWLLGMAFFVGSRAILACVFYLAMGTLATIILMVVLIRSRRNTNDGNQ
jgi:hypothetical protein